MMQAERPGLWQKHIPPTPCILIFCLLEGLTLGFPVAFLLPKDAHHLIPAPESVRKIVLLCCVGALLLLPIWSVATLRRYRGLRWLGIATFVVVFFWSSLTPAQLPAVFRIRERRLSQVDGDLRAPLALPAAQPPDLPPGARPL